ncbi:MAG: DUF2203 domain-containing protein [Candidatus Methylomirabilota bacterium]
MPPKHFTLEEANNLLPRLEPVMRRLIARRQELREHQERLAEFRALASRSGGALPGSRHARAKEESTRLLEEINDGVREIEALGCVIKDLDLGLVDFPASRGRVQVYLCWRLGEPEIRHWHGLQEGFAGRKPLGDDPVD